VEVNIKMKCLINLIETFIVIIWLNLVITGTAHAYLDPGIGSYVFQILMALFLSIAFGMKLFWKKIKLFFKGKKKNDRRQ